MEIYKRERKYKSGQQGDLKIIQVPGAYIIVGAILKTVGEGLIYSFQQYLASQKLHGFGKKIVENSW